MALRDLERQLWRALGSRGGRARAKKLTAEQRREIAAKGGRASKGRPKKKSRKKAKK